MTAETWTAIATVVISFFTIGLAVSGGIQAWLTREAINLTRDSIKLGNKEFIATHRPRLVVRFTQSDAIQPNKKPGAQLVVDNAGSAKAYIISKAGNIGQKRGADWI